MKIVYHILSFLINAFIITNIVDVILMGLLLPRFSRRLKEKSFFVKPNQNSLPVDAGQKDGISASFFEYQSGPECAGFSSAFLLRHLGFNARGSEVYKEVPWKLGNGAAFPKSIPGFFKKHGIKITTCSGNLTALKNEIARGNPVIVVIRSFVGKSYLHFSCVTGYDEETVYMADSIKDWVNADGRYYNRTVPVGTFKKLWNTSMLKMPLYRNMFYVLGQC